MSTAAFPYPQTATITLDHYEHMIERGAFTPPYNIRVELIGGKIVEKDTGEPAKFTLEHFEHMVAVGTFDPPYDIPVELLHGEMLMMSPIGEPHSQAIIALNEWSYDVLDRKRFMIRIQMPIRVPASQGEPEPDLAWVRRDASSNRPPLPESVSLLVEVADSSLAFDRTVKLTTYAQAGIPDYWIVNLIDEQIEVYRKPDQGNYRDRIIYRGDEDIRPLALLSASLTPSRIFRQI